MTTGSIVKVTPAFAATGPINVYGLFACVQVVFEVIMPLTDVEVCAFPEGTLLTKANRQIIRAINNTADACLTKVSLTIYRQSRDKKYYS